MIYLQICVCVRLPVVIGLSDSNDTAYKVAQTSCSSCISLFDICFPEQHSPELLKRLCGFLRNLGSLLIRVGDLASRARLNYTKADVANRNFIPLILVEGSWAPHDDTVYDQDAEKIASKT